MKKYTIEEIRNYLISKAAPKEIISKLCEKNIDKSQFNGYYYYNLSNNHFLDYTCI